MVICFVPKFIEEKIFKLVIDPLREWVLLLFRDIGKICRNKDFSTFYCKVAEKIFLTKELNDFEAAFEHEERLFAQQFIKKEFSH